MSGMGSASGSSRREKTAATLIAWSGYTKEEDTQRPLFDHYLVKSVHPDDLLRLPSGPAGDASETKTGPGGGGGNAGIQPSSTPALVDGHAS
jgi:hypothetical protein